jgi:hypothetical protein
MNLELLRQRLAAKHFAEPQVARKLELAVREIEQGLLALATYGHQFHLEPGPPWLDEHDWPRIYFHVKIAPNGRVVQSRFELSDLGGEAWGWYPTLEAAQHADGLAHQFHGRAGVALPTSALTVVKGTEKDESTPRPSRRDLVEALRRASAERASAASTGSTGSGVEGFVSAGTPSAGK